MCVLNAIFKNKHMTTFDFDRKIPAPTGTLPIRLEINGSSIACSSKMGRGQPNSTLEDDAFDAKTAQCGWRDKKLREADMAKGLSDRLRYDCGNIGKLDV